MTSGELSPGGRVPIRDWWWLAGLCFALFIVSMPLSSYPSSLVIIRDEWGITDTEAGLLNGLSSIGSVVGSLVLVPMTDRLRADRMLIATGFILAGSQLLFPLLTHNVVTGAPLRLLAGLGISGVYVTGTRLVAERFSHGGRGTAVGIYVTVFYLGGAASFAATGALLQTMDWRGAWAVLAALSFLTPLLCLLALRGYRPVPMAGASGRLDLGVLRNRSVAVIILGYFMHSVELGHVRTWLAPFLAFVLVTHGGIDSGEAAARAALIVGVSGMLGALSPFLGGLFSDRVGRLTAATILFGISGACSFAVGWLGGMPWWVILSLAVVYSITVGADSAIYSSGVTEIAEPGKLGSTLAVHSFCGFAAGIISPVMFGLILDLAGRDSSLGWGLGFGTAGVGGVIAIAAMLWVRGAAGPLLRSPRTRPARPSGA